jgi:hypothetical protein
MGNIFKDVLGIFGVINQMSLASKEKSALDRQIYYSKHPEAINALVKQFQQPLSAGLTAGTENVVNASLAQQGLSQAPGIQSQVLSQALAPYQQNEQQMAIAEAFKALGLPMEALQSIQSVMGSTDLAGSLKGILPGGSGQGSGGFGALLQGIFNPGSLMGPDDTTGITLPAAAGGGSGTGDVPFGGGV